MSPKFVDRAKIFVKAGDGGRGALSFRREKFLPKGGPDGGDGGRGGDVVLAGNRHLSTLLDFQYRRHFRAQAGRAGGGGQRTGADGEATVIDVPLGTVVFGEDSGVPIGEILRDGERLVAARGGKGGLGNLHFVSSVQRAPRKTAPPETGESRWILLELRLLADVGIVGPPNAGKSTLLSALTSARPKVADYPFTTLSPCLGVARSGERSLTLADIPGLIEGAHEGAGLGTEFLRHVRRTRALLYVVAARGEGPASAWSDYERTRNEIEKYDAGLLERPSLCVLNKIDILTERQIRANLKRFREHSVEPFCLSAREKRGLEPLVRELFRSA